MKSSAQPLVSVVTPVYNGAEYLAECIESVRAQTYQNWEYTIVNNCSTDGTAEIARRYAEKDRRIRVHDNREFLRAIPNHNLALRQISADSKYCKVVFGDDWIFPECLEKMVRLAEENPSIGIVGAYALEGPKVAWTGLPYSSKVVSGRKICREHFLNKLYVFGTATSVLYRADMVRERQPFYNEGNIHADTEVCFALLKSCDFGFVHQVLSFTRLRPGSLNEVSQGLHAYFPAMLHNLKTYGPDYLTEDELSGSLSKILSHYYRFLGKSLILRQEKQFWDFHRAKLKETGFGFSRFRVLRGTFATVLDAALRPKDIVRRVLKSRHSQTPSDPRPNHGSESTVMPAKETQKDGESQYMQRNKAEPQRRGLGRGSEQAGNPADPRF